MTTAAASAAVEPWTLPSRGRVGMLCLILTETAFFAIFIAAHLFYLGKNLSGPLPGEVLDLPVAATICLLSSSITITLAVRALRAGSVASFRLWWLATITLGALFLGSTALEWRRLILADGLTISANLFGTTFYSLVGFHGGHVAVGLVLLTLVLVLALRGHVGGENAERVEVLSWYWHFVDVVWVAVFTVVYVVGR